MSDGGEAPAAETELQLRRRRRLVAPRSAHHTSSPWSAARSSHEQQTVRHLSRPLPGPPRPRSPPPRPHLLVATRAGSLTLGPRHAGLPLAASNDDDEQVRLGPLRCVRPPEERGGAMAEWGGDELVARGTGSASGVQHGLELSSRAGGPPARLQRACAEVVSRSPAPCLSAAAVPGLSGLRARRRRTERRGGRHSTLQAAPHRR